MGTQTVIGCLFFSDGGAVMLEETITDASEDELHARDTATISIGTLFAGKTVTHGWVGATTCLHYANIKKAGGGRIPLFCGTLGVMDAGGGKMKVSTPHTLQGGDILAVYTEA